MLEDKYIAKGQNRTFHAELYKMVCEPDETDLDIHIPAVMLPQDAGTSLEKMLTSNSSGKLPFCICFSLNFLPHILSPY